MDAGLLIAPLFRLPLLVGAVLAVLLPLLGLLLRLRNEWLAALGLAHLAAASGLSGLAVGIPAFLGVPLARWSARLSRPCWEFGATPRMP
jgi:zinc transport system permease protein